MRSRQTYKKNFRLSIALLGLGLSFIIVFTLLELYVFLCIALTMVLEFIYLIFYYYSLKQIDNSKRVKYLKLSQAITYIFSSILFILVLTNIAIALFVTVQLIENRVISIPIAQNVLSRVGPSYYIFFIFNVFCAGLNIHYLNTKRKQAKDFVQQIQNPSFISAASEEVSYDSNEVRSKSQIEEICSICLDNYYKNKRQIVLPCQHKYHDSCIKEVLTYKRSCPLCRALA
ncbi:hypothetical protein ABPG74_017512 [Tetrahymena malaccensis]